MRDYQTVKSLVSNEIFPVPRSLTPEKVANCVLLSDRDELLHRLPKGGVVAEVGTQRGVFAKHIYEIAQPSEMHIFDLSFEKFQRGSLDTPIKMGSIILHAGDSSSELDRMRREGKEGYFDWIYIDADHRYEGVSRDINQAKHLIKNDGLLIFNAYTNYSSVELMQYGVVHVVNDLILDEGFELAYFALHPLGYHDVAVRRQRG